MQPATVCGYDSDSEAPPSEAGSGGYESEPSAERGLDPAASRLRSPRQGPSGSDGEEPAAGPLVAVGGPLVAVAGPLAADAILAVGS